MIIGSIWRNFYMKPMAWLVSLPTDKVLHFGASMVIMQMLFFLFESTSLAFAVTFAIGIFKEVVIDKLINKEKVDGGDLTADVLGICAGQMLLNIYGLLIDIQRLI